MIRAQRTAHARLWIVLGPLLALAVVALLALRPAASGGATRAVEAGAPAGGAP